MKIYFYLLLPSLLFIVGNKSIAQQDATFQWAKGIGSESYDYGNSIAVDYIGNVYITGYFTDTADFDPASGTANLISVGSQDIFFAKYDNNGNYLWAKRIGGINNDGSYSNAIDQSGNLYIAGYFIGTTDFDPGLGTANLSSTGSGDIFFAKYDTNGNYIWAKSIGSTGMDICISIVVDNSNNVFITGNFSSTSDFDPSSGTANLISAGLRDIFIAKYDSNGNYIWAKRIGSANEDGGTGIELDKSGNVLITGTFQGTVDFDPSVGTVNLLSVGNEDIFFAKYDNSGNYIWAKSVGSSNTDYGNSITVDSIGNVFIIGYFKGTTDFDPDTGTINLTSIGGSDIFFGKYDSNGNYLYAKSIGSINDEGGYSILVDDSGNVFIVGNFQGTTDFDPSVGISNLTSAGTSDIFFAKYDGSGNYLWAKGIGSIGGDYPFSIAMDGNSNIYLTGIFFGTVDFDTGVDTNNITSNGNFDIFFSKYSQSGNVGIDQPKVSAIIENNQSVIIYPNPFTTISTLALLNSETKANSLYHLMIFDLLGHEVKMLKSSTKQFEIDRGNLLKGMYFFKVADNLNIIGSGKILIAD